MIKKIEAEEGKTMEGLYKIFKFAIKTPSKWGKVEIKASDEVKTKRAKKRTGTGLDLVLPHFKICLFVWIQL